MFYIWTAGFFYKDWIGRFYPADLPWWEWLKFYAKHFNALEVNSSFYKLPAKSTIENYEKVDLTYVFKVPRLFTHFKKYDENTLNKFYQLLGGLINQNKFWGLLFQFSASATKQQVFDCLKFVRKAFKETDFFLELRKLELIQDFQENEVEKLKSLNTSLVYVDGKLKNNVLIYEWKDLGFEKCYFRFHGRGEKLYNYLYSEDELEEFAEKIKKLCKNKEKCFIFFNNTVKAQAVENALKIKEILNF